MALVLKWYFPPPVAALNAKKPLPHQNHFKFRNPSLSIAQNRQTILGSSRCQCQTETPTFYPQTSDDEYYDVDEEEDEMDDNSSSSSSSSNGRTLSPPPLIKKRKRYKKAYPGESKGITEELRFVAMKLRNTKSLSSLSDDDGSSSESATSSEAGSWQPTMEGFAKHLVDCKLVFETLERIVEESDDVAYAYFRKTGLERSEFIARDIEWLREMEVEIPEPSNRGVNYAKYLEEISKDNPPSFLTHFYNVHFSHVAGGQVIVKQVCERLLEGREMEFCRWDGDVQELLKDARDKLNKLGEHWSRSDKNKSLSEASKAFKYMGEILRLIIL